MPTCAATRAPFFETEQQLRPPHGYCSVVPMGEDDNQGTTRIDNSRSSRAAIARGLVGISIKADATSSAGESQYEPRVLDSPADLGVSEGSVLPAKWTSHHGRPAPRFSASAHSVVKQAPCSTLWPSHWRGHHKPSIPSTTTATPIQKLTTNRRVRRETQKIEGSWQPRNSPAPVPRTGRLLISACVVCPIFVLSPA